MASSIPLSSLEVRWFFEGSIKEHSVLKSWFETTRRKESMGLPEWKGRLNDSPDIYLLVPGASNLGIKWREGNFQVKGQVASLGKQIFCGSFCGCVERWTKWSYSQLPDAYERFFSQEQSGLNTVAVHKTRALRKLRLNTLNGGAEEVESGVELDRGLGFELTELRIGTRSYCSLAFEAFPDDSAMNAAFAQAVETYLADLDRVVLSVANSHSYPSWLATHPL